MNNSYKKEIGQEQLKGEHDGKECPICMEQLKENEKITTECNHDFHRECFVQNCLTELSKGNFKQRDRENKVFQCPNCRGDTKAVCLNDPEVRAIYEGLQVNSDDIDIDDRLEFHRMIEILEDKLENTIQQSENGIISDEAQELFLGELHSELLSIDDLSDADIGYIFEGLEKLLDNAEIEYELHPMMVYEFTRKIQEQLKEFEEQDEGEFMGGKLKRDRKTKGRKKHKGKGKGKKTQRGKTRKGRKKTKKTKKTKKGKSRRRKGGTITQGFGFKGLTFNKTTGNKYWKSNPETGELEPHDEDCYGVGKFKWCKRK